IRGSIVLGRAVRPPVMPPMRHMAVGGTSQQQDDQNRNRRNEKRDDQGAEEAHAAVHAAHRRENGEQNIGDHFDHYARLPAAVTRPRGSRARHQRGRQVLELAVSWLVALGISSPAEGVPRKNVLTLVAPVLSISAPLFAPAVSFSAPVLAPDESFSACELAPDLILSALVLMNSR